MKVGQQWLMLLSPLLCGETLQGLLQEECVGRSLLCPSEYLRIASVTTSSAISHSPLGNVSKPINKGCTSEAVHLLSLIRENFVCHASKYSRKSMLFECQALFVFIIELFVTVIKKYWLPNKRLRIHMDHLSKLKSCIQLKSSCNFSYTLKFKWIKRKAP